MASEADYGVSTPALLANYDPDTQSWRTPQRSLFGGFSEFSETLPRSGLMRNGTAYQLQPLVPLIAETESGSWPTPTANEYEASAERTTRRREELKAKHMNGNGFGLTVGQAVQLWATPQTHDRSEPGKGSRERGGRHRDLPSEVRMWGTPTTRDYKDSGDCSNVPENGLLGRMAKSFSGMTGLRGSLNPDFHLWLMGFPVGFNELSKAEIASCRQSRKSSGGQSSKRKE